MSDRNTMIGDVEILRVVDAIIDYPFPLDEFYPGVPITAWDYWRKQYPASFASEKTHRLVYACYLLRTAGHSILVDTGDGTSLGSHGYVMAAEPRRPTGVWTPGRTPGSGSSS